MTVMTTEHGYTAGLIPAVNDLAAGISICGAYITRFGLLAEGVASTWWHLPLLLTTDLILPVLAAVWLLGVPVWKVWKTE